MTGKLTWVFPDGELPPSGEGPMFAHESVVILNPGPATATIRAVVYFADQTPWEFTTTVAAERSAACAPTSPTTWAATRSRSRRSTR